MPRSEIPGSYENQNDQDGLKGAEPVICRLSTELPQMVEDDIPRHSVEEYYLTYLALPDLSDSFWPYRSAAIYSFEGLELSYARDVTSEYSLIDVINLQLHCQVELVSFALHTSGGAELWRPCGQTLYIYIEKV
nr:neuroblastoma breakpoint family member 3-like isoform X3 [Vicugna pacos]